MEFIALYQIFSIYLIQVTNVYKVNKLLIF